jgi:uncharacterized protein YqfB (UPF0267 family)
MHTATEVNNTNQAAIAAYNQKHVPEDLLNELVRSISNQHSAVTIEVTVVGVHPITFQLISSVHVIIEGFKLTTLKNIRRIIPKMVEFYMLHHNKTDKYDIHLTLVDEPYIESNIISVLLIPDLVSIRYLRTNAPVSLTDPEILAAADRQLNIEQAIKIVDAHIATAPGSFFECQTSLMDHGLSEHAVI